MFQSSFAGSVEQVLLRSNTKGDYAKFYKVCMYGGQ